MHRLPAHFIYYGHFSSNPLPFKPVLSTMLLRPGILKAIAYFDLFSHPVTLEEIRFFLDREIPEPVLAAELETLVSEKCLFRLGTFYSLRNDPSLADKRV